MDRDAVGACARAIARRAGVGSSTLAITINEGATTSAVAGLGIAASRENSARAELEAGKLVRVLPDSDFGSIEVNVFFANGKTIKPAARAFADFLLRELRAAEDGSGQGIAATPRHST